jgi:hypothetical protein
MADCFKIETTVLWKRGKEMALSGQKNEFIATFGGAFRKCFGKLTQFEVVKRSRGAPFESVALYGEREAVRLSYANPDAPILRRPDRVLEAEFVLWIDMSSMDNGVREAFLSALFQFLTHGRGIMGRETYLFQERLVVNGTFIRLPDHVREPVHVHKDLFMQAVLI